MTSFKCECPARLWRSRISSAPTGRLGVALKRHDSTLSAAEREQGVGEFIDLVVAVDSILQVQAKADATYFATNCGRPVEQAEADRVAAHFLKAYRWRAPAIRASRASSRA